MELSEFFRKNSKAVLAFSGGADSSYLLYEAVKNNADVRACYVRSAFQPEFEYEDAKRIAEGLCVTLTYLTVDVLSDKRISDNPPDRCYFCKKKIFQTIKKYADKEGYNLILDGTNASDCVDERPGMKALSEAGVRSPLRECGLTKTMIRENSHKAGLFTWDKPAYACLATRMASGIHLTKENLSRAESAENFLYDLGFKDFRVRQTIDDAAMIQIHRDQRPLFLEMRPRMFRQLKDEYSAVFIDFEERDRVNGGLKNE